MVKAQEPESRPFQVRVQVDRPWRSVVLGTTKYERTGIAQRTALGRYFFFKREQGEAYLRQIEST